MTKHIIEHVEYGRDVFFVFSQKQNLFVEFPFGLMFYTHIFILKLALYIFEHCSFCIF